MDQAEKELRATYKGYKNKPLTHPDYKSEWNSFWTRRYKELKAGK